MLNERDTMLLHRVYFVDQCYASGWDANEYIADRDFIDISILDDAVALYLHTRALVGTRGLRLYTTEPNLELMPLTTYQIESRYTYHSQCRSFRDGRLLDEAGTYHHLHGDYAARFYRDILRMRFRARTL